MFVSSITRYGGGERWMCDAAAGLKRRGHAVRLAARPRSVLERKARERGIEVTTVEMRADYDPVAIAKLARLITHFRPDVVCANLDREIRLSGVARAVAGVFAGRAVRRAKLIPRRGSEFPLKNNAHYRFFYNRVVDRVIVNSAATRKTMFLHTPWFSPEKATVVYNGIEFGTYDALAPMRAELGRRFRRSLAIPDDAPIVLVVAELNERKGHRYIIEAAPSVLDVVPDARFVFVGEGDLESKIRSQLLDRHLEGRCFLLGFRDDVPEILTASNVLCLPSRVEGFGYVLIEAMAASLPVVASNASSIPEIVEEGRTGFLHPVGDSEAIGDRLRLLLRERGLAERMGRRGNELAREKFNLAAMLEQLERIFFEGSA